MMKCPYLRYYSKLLVDRDETRALLSHFARSGPRNGFSEDQAARKLRRIDGALARIEDGVYGICVECHASITPERLESLPYAELCLACQRRRESIV